MNDTDALLGPWVQRFLMNHLVTERNLSRNTCKSYRDTFKLLVPFACAQLGKQNYSRLAGLRVPALPPSGSSYFRDLHAPLAHGSVQVVPRDCTCSRPRGMAWPRRSWSASWTCPIRRRGAWRT